MIWMMIAIPVLFILFWELLALATKQRFFPTWSRLIRQLQLRYTNGRIIVAIITLIIMESITVWMVLHFYCGEGAVLCIDELLFLWEDFCTSIGIPC